MHSPSATPTPITPPRVPLIDQRTGLIDRAWYMFFLSLFRAAEGALDNENLGPSPESLAASLEAALQSVTQELQTQPVSVVEQVQPLLEAIAQRLDTLESSQTGELQQQINTLRQEVQTAPKPELGSMAPLEQDNVPWLTFNNAPSPVPTAVGSMYWDGGTTMNVQMTTNVLGRINESEYVYVKASSAITKGELCYHTGAVGASGVITAAPTPLNLANPNEIVGIAAEDIALNAFGLIQISGDLRGFNTTGGSVGETWADGDALYYNPAFVGSMTNVKPLAPNQKTYIGEVVNAAPAGSGSMHIRIVPGTVLGGTDSNVQFGTLADKDLIQYDSTLLYWKNVAATSVAVGNLAGGAANQIPYQSAPSTTTFSSNFLYDGTNMAVGGSLNASYRLNLVGGGLSWGNDTTVRGVNTYDASNVYIGSFTNTPVVFNTNNIERMRIDSSGNLIFTGTGQRLQGDFTNATVANRAMFQSSTVNGNTSIAALPNGTATQSSFVSLGSSDPANASYISLQLVGGTEARLDANRTGTGAYLPLSFRTSNAESMRIGTDGNVGIGAGSTASTRLYAKGSDATSSNSCIVAENSSGTKLFFCRNDGLFNTGAAASSPYNNTTANAANVNVDTSGNLLRSTSSLRYKTDVQDAEHGLADVLKLRSVTYKGKNDGEKTFGGLIAEEVHDAGLTEFVVYDDNGQPDALHYGNMVGLLAKAMQEQQAIIDDLKARIAVLESR